MLDQAWLIPILPLLASTLIAFFGRRLGPVVAPLLGVLATAVGFFISLSALFAIRDGLGPFHASFDWAQLGDTTIRIGLQMGAVEVAVVTMVTFAATFIQLYAMGYMRGDAKYNRFFAVVTLFVTGMLTTVMADNLLLLLVGWEIMGFASYSLIGHWFEKIENVWAAMKAFITTRIGDLGMLAAAFILFMHAGTLSFDGIFEAVAAAPAGSWWITAAALLLLWAAIGKAAQLPLHIWLPDAMAGPTPVSALIHAATMVAAGVFLVARNYPLFEASATAMTVVAWVGALSALFAAIVAVLQEDIKRVLAYSTMSQLGYMMLALGVGGFSAGIYHLITHGYFKALLFLGAGSVIVAMHHEQNIHRMGGLLKKLPITAITFLIGTLALAGVYPFSGYYSKDEILLFVYEANSTLFWIGVLVAFLTAFYMTRAFILTFLGKPRDAKAYEQAHESPAVMLIPLLALSVPAFTYGFGSYALFGQGIDHFLGHPLPAAVLANSQNVVTIVTAAALLGIVGGFLLFGVAKPAVRRQAIQTFAAPYQLVKNAFFIDQLYKMVFVRGTMAVSKFSGAFDRYVIDGIVNGIAAVAVALGAATRRLADGSAQGYMAVLFTGVLLAIIVFQVIGG